MLAPGVRPLDDVAPWSVSLAATRMHISVTALRRIASALFDRLENRGHASVAIREDYYWEIDRAQRLNLDEQPDNLSVGQLTEDWFNLSEMTRDETLCVVYGLTWLAAILREIGETIPD